MSMVLEKNSGKIDEIKEIYLVVTKRCNFDCPYCYIQEKQGDMDVDTGKKAVDILLDSPGSDKTIHFFGGEPLLAFELISEIVNYSLTKSMSIQKNVSFKITTNGSLLDDRMKSFLKEHKFMIILSIHKNGQKDISHIQNNLDFFQDYQNLKISLLSYPDNIDDLKDLINYVIDNKISKRLMLITAMGYPWDEMSVSKLKEVYSLLVNSYFRTWIKDITIENFESFINYPLNRFVPPFRNEISVLPSGDLILCNFMMGLGPRLPDTLIIGNVNESILQEHQYLNDDHPGTSNRFPLNYCSEECSKLFLGNGRRLAESEIKNLAYARGVLGEIIGSTMNDFCIFPSSHLITLTEECSQNCLYCYAQKGDRKLRRSTADKLMNFIFKNSPMNLNLFLQGNEPLMNFDIVKHLINKSIEYKGTYSKSRVDITLFSNLSEIDRIKLDFLIKNNIYIHTSLDGPKDLHEKNRPGSDFDDLVSNIKYIISSGGNLSAAAVITKYSLSRYKDIIDVYRDLGMKRFSLRPLVAAGNAENNWSHIGYTSEQFIEFWRNSLEYLTSLYEKGCLLFEERTIMILKKLNGISDSSTALFSPPCSGLKHQVAYDTQGDIYPCDEARAIGSFRIGNIDKMDILAKALIKEPFSSFDRPDSSCDDCHIIDEKQNRMRRRVYKNQIRHLKMMYTQERFRRLFQRWLR